ncbi:glutathione S-transferase family protein [Dyella solisilvae]|uniref:Glutathione S-transferase family protein n=1 Tax=Dyella solisilvae TaxID=1920168 RepID=A0A370K3E5_9GAMM|nr:glutathione S-transferase family protein [Dyella solisilvae]RDI97193.1 glutathione S-transferase family protein [Dyella solisilvae]
MSPRFTVIGNYISPYVRKVLVCLELKGQAYQIDPIAPFVGNERFGELSPLRRIPVLIDGELVLNDSSVICQYLEDCFPAPSLYPTDAAQRAKARWLEEYCDTHLASVLVWKLFYQKVLRRRFFGEETDEAMMNHALAVEIPAALDYLERQLPDDGFAFGALSIADISIACYFRTASFVRYAIDAARWPRMANLVERVQSLPAFQALARLEDVMLRVPLAEQREVLQAHGAPLTSWSLGGQPPRKGFARME